METQPDQPTESVAAPDGGHTPPYHPERRRAALRLLLDHNLSYWSCGAPSERMIITLIGRCKHRLDAGERITTVLIDELWRFAKCHAGVAG